MTNPNRCVPDQANLVFLQQTVTEHPLCPSRKDRVSPDSEAGVHVHHSVAHVQSTFHLQETAGTVYGLRSGT